MSASGHDLGNSQSQDVSLCVQTSPHARVKRKIATLMEDIEILKQDKLPHSNVTGKQLTTSHRDAVIRHMVILYTPIEDLVTENDQHCEETDNASTADQDRLQHGYVELMKVLLWFHEKLASIDHEESEDMLKKLK
ncbi:uncharacterized protein BJ212DRAFT_1483785 [Suillus subaureus]|uniref:Uncharacterized protein n=1 Tax=Suillus subaureus TaxID=48587 RepID=A0A9P7E5G5_9AGAM|nr:uncharacterized protein BJ212DRAFT_1483785 [Suillus subaureus]KAG1811110.1 hypothetical protein BJ212DRAFT_1483785 [Suillus subaureus]